VTSHYLEEVRYGSPFVMFITKTLEKTSSFKDDASHITYIVLYRKVTVCMQNTYKYYGYIQFWINQKRMVKVWLEKE